MNICKFTPPAATCCFTGHRNIPDNERVALQDRIDEVVGMLYDRGVRHFRCGGALGFDTLAAVSVLRLRANAPDARLVLVLPCRDQTARWSSDDKRIYERIRASADEVVYSAVEYSRDCMLRRNRALVDGSGVCVAYMNGASGGTAYTVRYAARSSVEIINLGTYAWML